MEFLVVYFLWFKSLIFTKLFNISYFLDVTNILHPDGNNLLAVLVHPPDHPGSIPLEGGQGGDHEVRSYIYNPIHINFLIHVM
jgi:hypothetical protein